MSFHQQTNLTRCKFEDAFDDASAFEDGDRVEGLTGQLVDRPTPSPEYTSGGAIEANRKDEIKLDACYPVLSSFLLCAPNRNTGLEYSRCEYCPHLLETDTNSLPVSPAIGCSCGAVVPDGRACKAHKNRYGSVTTTLPREKQPYDRSNKISE